jgi:cellulose synthase/poly-beta-1,6-N-acetylglucosamine synthase-like glycosyltransferase
MIVHILSFILFLCYSALIAAITIGWWKLKVFENGVPPPEVKISVIVAVRNEASTIQALLASLLNQDYPSEWFEILIVDDHSTDVTAELGKEFIARHAGPKNIRFVSLKGEKESGKKSAIHKGIQSSTGELIVITDADCTSGVHWISTMAAFYQKHKPQMILGPVRMTNDGSFFGKLQTLEFISLISSAAGSCSAGFPILANGANIGFTRKAYESCGGFAGNMLYPSGDDMFLMLSIKKEFGPKSILFLRSAEAIVDPPAVQRLKPFVQQRMRWVSKSRGYTDPWLIAASVVVLLTNVWLVGMLFLALISPVYIGLFLVLYFFKMLADLPLMLGYSRFQRSVSLFWMFPFMELLNAVYTSVIGIAGNLGKYEWKGRRSATDLH